MGSTVIDSSRRFDERFLVVREILVRHDPIRIAITPDEYDPEVRRIVTALEGFENVKQLADGIYAIFVEMFDATTAGTRCKYDAIAVDLWRRLRDSDGRLPPP